MSYFVYQSFLYTGLMLYVWWRVTRQGLPFRIAWNLALILMVAGFVGARLMHVVYENPEIYQADPWRILEFWQGGFVFFGGAAAAFAACWLYLRHEKEDFLEWADFYAPVFALGYALGRIGCLIAGCCYGVYCDAPWAVHSRHPTQIYAFLTEIVVFLYLLRREKNPAPKGHLFAFWLVGHGLGRLFMESYRADFRGAFVAGLSISSWVSLFFFGAGVALYAATLPTRRQP